MIDPESESEPEHESEPESEFEDEQPAAKGKCISNHSGHHWYW
jgi:hypothetical protein